MSTVLLRQIQLVALYQSALGAAELQTHFTDGATTSWFTRTVCPAAATKSRPQH
jgi:hypothetical protein